MVVKYKNGMQEKHIKSCAFCDIVQGVGLQSSLYREAYGENRRNVILNETKTFVVFPGVGAIKEGYLIIASKKHVRDSTQLNELEIAELERLIVESREVINRLYGEVTIYENGGLNGDGLTATCVEHMHYHVLPTDINPGNWLSSQFETKEIELLKEIKELRNESKHYIFLEDNKGCRKIFLCNQMPIQLIRQIWAEKLNVEYRWDWKKYPEIINMRKTFEKLTGWKH